MIRICATALRAFARSFRFLKVQPKQRIVLYIPLVFVFGAMIVGCALRFVRKSNDRSFFFGYMDYQFSLVRFQFLQFIFNSNS